MIRTFISKSILVAFGFTLLLITNWFIFTMGAGLPGPMVSNSISLNYKTYFAEEKDLKHPDVIAIGSSMTLNNLHSEVVINNLKTESYLNYSAWGIRPSQILSLLKILMQKYTPSLVIIVTNIADYQRGGPVINESTFSDYLADKHSRLYNYLFAYTPRSFFLDSRRTHKLRKIKNSYESLAFDPFGGVSLKKKGFLINEKRWGGNSLKLMSPDSINYNSIKNIAELCKHHESQLVLIQSPFREGFLLGQDSVDLKTFNQHIEMISKIAEDFQIPFINATNSIWQDSLFVDASHFSKLGAQKFSEYIFRELHVSYPKLFQNGKSWVADSL
jgi:hypothetical protein